MNERIALDIRKYDTPEKLSSIVEDTASLSIEASSKNISRVNPFYYVKKGEDLVISPGKDKRDISEKFSTETPLDQLATEAGVEIRRMLLREKGDFSIVWISPSGPYPETRVVMGVKKTKRNGDIEYLKCYGVSTCLSRNDCLLLGQLLISISPLEYEFPQSPDDLRSIAIKLSTPNGEEGFGFLSKIIVFPEKDVFNDILDGTADKNKSKAVKVARIATAPIRHNPKVIYSNPIGYGSYIENVMASLGYGMDPSKFGCGKSNTEMLFSNTFSSITEVPIYSSTEGWHDGTCRVCGTSTWVGPCCICKPCEAVL